MTPAPPGRCATKPATASTLGRMLFAEFAGIGHRPGARP
jgi:hypothetical protein